MDVTRCNGQRRMGRARRAGVIGQVVLSLRSRIFQDTAVSRLELQRIIYVCEAFGAESAVGLALFVSRPLSFVRGTTLTRTRDFLTFHFQCSENDPFVLALLLPTQTQTPFGV